MIIKFKKFESIRDEYPGMFAPEKEEDKPQIVPGFEIGAIDPEDTDPWIDFDGNEHEAESEQYKKFLKITKERNFKETDRYLKIDTLKLYHDFYMSIFNSRKYYSEFLRNEIMDKYLVDSVKDYNGNLYSGIVEYITFIFDDYNAFIDDIRFKNIKLPKLIEIDFVITIDKLKTTSNNYNL